MITTYNSRNNIIHMTANSANTLRGRSPVFMEKDIKHTLRSSMKHNIQATSPKYHILLSTKKKCKI